MKPFAVKPSSDRCGASACRLPGKTFGNDYLKLRSGKGGEAFFERRIVVPRRHDGDPGGAAPDREFALPLRDVLPRRREPLTPPAIAKPARRLDHSLLESGAI